MEKKVVLITGGTAGIGMQTAWTLADKGYSIIIVGRNKSAGNQLIDKISRNGGEATYLCADVSVEKEVIHMVSSVISRFGHIDICLTTQALRVYWARWKVTLKRLLIPCYLSISKGSCYVSNIFYLS